MLGAIVAEGRRWLAAVFIYAILIIVGFAVFAAAQRRLCAAERFAYF